MSTVYVDGYKSALSVRETEKAIRFIKDTFQKKLAEALHLEYISAPLFLRKGRGLNDDLNGVERKVHFDLKELDRTADIYQASEYDYVNYLQQKAKYKNFASVDAYLANDETYTKLTTARDNPTYRWAKEDLIYAVNEALINRETGSTDQSTKLANVSGRNITLIGENVGTSTGTQTITVEQLSKGDQNGNHIHYLKPSN